MYVHHNMCFDAYFWKHLQSSKSSPDASISFHSIVGYQIVKFNHVLKLTMPHNIF
jgi:hypothetical protein